MITTKRRLEYAQGFIGLGMVNEAADELEAIAFADRLSDEVLSIRIQLYIEAKQWDMVIDLSVAMTTQWPEKERPWISMAYALRELNRIAEARDVLIMAEPLHGETSSTLHYNLACYYSLLGELGAAKERLNRACRMNKNLKTEALDDRDLAALWDQIGSMR